MMYSVLAFCVFLLFFVGTLYVQHKNLKHLKASFSRLDDAANRAAVLTQRQSPSRRSAARAVKDEPSVRNGLGR